MASDPASSPAFAHRVPNSSYATHCSLRDHRPSQQIYRHQLSTAEDTNLILDDVNLENGPIIRPPPSARTTTATAYTGYDPREPSLPLEHGISRQPSSLSLNLVDTCQPYFIRATTTIQQHTSRASLHSPTKSLASFIPTRTVIKSTASQPKIRAGARALQNWFSGSSAQVKDSTDYYSSDSDSYNSEDDDDDDDDKNDRDMINIFTRSPAFTGESSTDSTPKSSPAPKPKPQPSTASSRFAWLLSTQKSPSNPAPPTPKTPTYHNLSDELLNLDISQSLFPHGNPDPLAPSSFHDLLSASEALLSRYQTAYRELSSTLADTRAEQSAQVDELDEAETRVRHLKMQLETMAKRADDQDAQMRALMEDLTFERRARQEEEEARKHSLALVREGAAMEAERKRARISGSELSVDSGFESECESESASVFSARANCFSPTDTLPSSSGASVHDQTHDSTPKPKRPAPTQRQSTYEKVRSGNLESGGWGCVNCEGGAQASVWGRLAREREENCGLRGRVRELEDAVDDALAFVDRAWGGVA